PEKPRWARLLRATPKRRAHGISEPRAYWCKSQLAVPRDDDVRAQRERERLDRDRACGAREGHQLRRYGERVLGRRERALRRHRAARRPARVGRARDEGILPAGPEGSECARLEPP